MARMTDVRAIALLQPDVATPLRRSASTVFGPLAAAVARDAAVGARGAVTARSVRRHPGSR